jgi:hypothetical protein
MGEELIRALVGFPKFAIGWVVGLIVAIITDLHIATLAVTGILAGFVFHSALVGVFAFFVAYSASRIVSYIANAIGMGTNRLADATYQGLTAPPHTVDPASPVV